MWSTIGLAITLAVVLAVLIAIGGSHRNDLLATMIMVMIFGLPCAMAGGAMAFSGWNRSLGGKWLLIGGLILLVLTFGVALFVVWAVAPGLANLAMAGALLAAGALSGAGFLLLKAPSKSGRKIMDNIEGFRQYLGVAEEDRLNALNPPDKTPELFERFLPYAVALDVQNEWAKKFAGVLAAAAAAGAATATGWYVGSGNWASDPVSFANHIGSDLSQTISSSSTAPGSSGGGGGSGGGGSSGGGGGGGGGSGW